MDENEGTEKRRATRGDGKRDMIGVEDKHLGSKEHADEGGRQAFKLE